MSIRKFHSVEDMPEPRRSANAREGIAAACALSEMCRGIGSTSIAPRGVYKFASVEAADMFRQSWELPARRRSTS